VPLPVAKWNPARDVWETDSLSLLCGHSTVFSATFPVSGMTRSGVAYELQTSGLLMVASESLLLPTPRAQARETPYAREDYHHNLEEWVGHALSETLHLLPTPRSALGDKRNNLIYYRNAPQQNLENALAPLTPGAHGAPTPLPSDDGSECWGDLLRLLLPPGQMADPA
jgi:hypothetical protein